MTKKEYPETTVVDEDDNVIGQMDLFEARKKGLIVRVAHILILNSKGEMLLQQRGPNVLYPNLWNAAAAGHVDGGDSYEGTAIKELEEEMGATLKLENIEKVDHIFTDVQTNGQRDAKFHTIFRGYYDGEVHIKVDEVADYRWVSIPELMREIENTPNTFTRSFALVMNNYIEKFGTK